MKQKIYHLTPHENTKAILEEGIKANEDGDIYVFTDMIVADTIAKNQVFTAKYSVFEINRKGIGVKLMPDDCGELSQAYQRIIKQNKIDPKYLELIACEMDIVTDRPTSWDYFVYENCYNIPYIDAINRWIKYKKCYEKWELNKCGKKPNWYEFLLEGYNYKKDNLADIV